MFRSTIRPFRQVRLHRKLRVPTAGLRIFALVTWDGLAWFSCLSPIDSTKFASDPFPLKRMIQVVLSYFPCFTVRQVVLGVFAYQQFSGGEGRWYIHLRFVRFLSRWCLEVSTSGCPPVDAIVTRPYNQFTTCGGFGATRGSSIRYPNAGYLIPRHHYQWSPGRCEQET